MIKKNEKKKKKITLTAIKKSIHQYFLINIKYKTIIIIAITITIINNDNIIIIIETKKILQITIVN